MRNPTALVILVIGIVVVVVNNLQLLKSRDGTAPYMNKLSSSRYRISSFVESSNPEHDDIELPSYESEDLDSSDNVALRGAISFDETLNLSAWDLEYFGQWKLANNSKQIFNFRNNGGESMFFNDTESRILKVQLTDGKYEDKQVVILAIEYGNNTIENNMSFTNPNCTMTIYYYNHYKQISSSKCNDTSFNVKYFYTDTMLPANEEINEKINASFAVNSLECGFAVNMMFSDNDGEIQQAAMNYCIVVTILCCGHLYACIQMIKRFAENDADANKLSMMTVGFFTCWDLMLCLFHLYQALTNDEYFHFFITSAFWYFILASIFETRMLMLLWKARYGNVYVTNPELRRGVMVFYFKFYGFLIIIIMLAHYFIYTSWFLVLSAGIFIPQIAHNAMRGHRLKLDWYYVFGLGVLRVVLPLYARGCPENIFGLTPDKNFCLTYASVLSFQLFIMYLQSKLGSRFFVPSCLLPPKFNYHVDIVYGSAEDEACPICMEDISKPPADPHAPLMELEPGKKLKIMQTPCSHKFHQDCLKNWMNVKLECPLCKAAIPPLD